MEDGIILRASKTGDEKSRRARSVLWQSNVVPVMVAWVVGDAAGVSGTRWRMLRDVRRSVTDCIFSGGWGMDAESPQDRWVDVLSEKTFRTTDGCRFLSTARGVVHVLGSRGPIPFFVPVNSSRKLRCRSPT